MENRFRRFLNKFSQYIIIRPTKREFSEKFQDWVKEQGISADYRSFEENKNLNPFNAIIIWEIPSQKDLFLEDINNFISNNIEYIGGFVNNSVIKLIQKETYKGIIKPIEYFGENKLILTPYL